MTNATKTFLLPGGRVGSTLDLARQLHAAGHRVLCVDTISWHICRFSNAVDKSFRVPSPRFETEAFVDAMVKIVKEEKVDIIIPTYEEVIYLAQYIDRFPKSCRVFADAFDTLHHMHNKWFFNQRQQQYEIPTPQTFLVHSEAELRALPFRKPFALKPCYSRASQSILKVDPSRPLPHLKYEPHNPYVAQEWLVGKKYCTYSVAQQGELLAHATYPMEFAINENSCVNFTAVDHPKILAWTKRYIAKEKFTGQVGFDFMELPSGQLYVIECNPRSTHGLLLFKPDDRLDSAFLNRIQKPILARAGSAKQIMTGMLLFGWQSAWKQGKLKEFIKTFFGTRDVVLNLKDPKPFLVQPFVFCCYMYHTYKTKLALTNWFTSDFNWNGDEKAAYEEVEVRHVKNRYSNR